MLVMSNIYFCWTQQGFVEHERCTRAPQWIWPPLCLYRADSLEADRQASTKTHSRHRDGSIYGMQRRPKGASDLGGWGLGEGISSRGFVKKVSSKKGGREAERQGEIPKRENRGTRAMSIARMDLHNFLSAIPKQKTEFSGKISESYLMETPVIVIIAPQPIPTCSHKIVEDCVLLKRSF